jgi:hypothetical protein
VFAVFLAASTACNQDSYGPGFGLEDAGVDARDTSQIDEDVADVGRRDVFEPSGPPCWPKRAGNSQRSRESNCPAPTSFNEETTVSNLGVGWVDGVRVGWSGSLYAIQGSIPDNDPASHRLLRIDAGDSQVHTLVSYDGAWKPSYAENSVVLDHDGRIWVSEHRGQEGSTVVRVSAYSRDGDLLRRHVFPNEYNGDFGFMGTDDRPKIQLSKQGSSMGTDRTVFRIGETSVSKVGLLEEVSGQICTSGAQVYHLHVPDNFDDFDDARPTLVRRSATNGYVVKE